MRTMVGRSRDSSLFLREQPLQDRPMLPTGFYEVPHVAMSER